MLTWEKCHFMVKEGIILDHKVLGSGIEVDKEKNLQVTISHKRESHSKLSRECRFQQKIHKRFLTSRMTNDPAYGTENLAADHLSQLENPDLGKLTKAQIRDLFPKERLMAVSDKNNEPWLFPKKLKSKWCRPFSVSKDMRNGAIELYDEDGNEFIVNKQRVKPYQKDVLDTNRDDDIKLEDEEEVT
ncbi:hypothetical protein Tco_0018274 [Tanacetum coccineum]